MNRSEHILLDADQCVLCGLCLPHCPSYGLRHDEADSPRGRIALMQAVARGALEADAGLRLHLDRCLGCRACEAMCPSQVRYGRLLRNTRALLYSTSDTHALADALSSPKRRRWLGRGLRLLRNSGLQRLAQKLAYGQGNRARLLRGLPAGGRAPALPEFVPAQGERRGEVSLFTGCTGDLLQRDVLHAAAKLLSRLGYAVHAPMSQGCCGALYAHEGNVERAAALAEANLEVFSCQANTLLGIASGCTAFLRDYGELLGSSQAAGFAQRVSDIHVFLAGLDWPEALKFLPLEAKVAVHEPCSLRNVLHGQASVYALLQKIPRLEVLALPGNDRCCGAAGSYLLRHAKDADALREDKLDALERLAPRYLVSANLGCAMHLAAGLRARGLMIEVLHPISLLARQLARGRNSS
jgi:glycolate oxidase iron-sulfur subunit